MALTSKKFHAYRKLCWRSVACTQCKLFPSYGRLHEEHQLRFAININCKYYIKVRQQIFRRRPYSFRCMTLSGRHAASASRQKESLDVDNQQSATDKGRLMMRRSTRHFIVTCISALLFAVPLSAFAATYSAIAVGNGYLNSTNALQVVALGTDGFAYIPVWQASTGSWYTGSELPGQSVPFSQLVPVRNTNTSTLQVVGLSTTGLPYVAGYQDSTGAWHAGGAIPSNGAQYTVLEAKRGGCGSDPVQVLGIGTDGYIHEVAEQDSSGNWHETSGILGGTSVQFQSFSIGYGSNGDLEVFAISTGSSAYPDSAYQIGYQDATASGCPWVNQESLIIAGVVGTQILQLNGNGGNLQVLMPAGWTSNTVAPSSQKPSLFLLAWQQNSTGAWNRTGASGWISNCPLTNKSLTAGTAQAAGAPGNSSQLQIWGRSGSGQSGLLCWQNTSGTWEGVLGTPSYPTQLQSIAMGNGASGDAEVIGLATTGDIILSSYQDSGTGTWYAGEDLSQTAVPYTGGSGGGGGLGGGGGGRCGKVYC